MSEIEFKNPDSVRDNLKPLLSNSNIFGTNLYKAGIGKKIEEIFKEEISDIGAVRETLKKYIQ